MHYDTHIAITIAIETNNFVPVVIKSGHLYLWLFTCDLLNTTEELPFRFIHQAWGIERNYDKGGHYSKSNS